MRATTDVAERTLSLARQREDWWYAHLPTTGTMVDRIERTVRQATREQYRAGRRWYRRFLHVAERLSDAYGVPTHVVAGVLAWTSPRVSVRTSVAMTRDLLDDWTSGRPDPFGVDGLVDFLWAAWEVLEAGGIASMGLDRAVEHAYRLAGRRLGLAPREVQAIAWCVFRERETGASAEAEALELVEEVRGWTSVQT